MDHSTEQIILKAARKIFTIKGFDGARMQEIADEAGINKALLHYYFRSKDKLFEAIFGDILNTVFSKIVGVLMSPIPLFEKIASVSFNYIELLKQNPDLAIFVFHEISRNPDRLVGNIKNAGANFEMIKIQINQEVEAGNINPIKAEHLIANLISMCIFPFIAKPVFMGMAGFDNEDYDLFIEERKQVIPHTIISSIKTTIAFLLITVNVAAQNPGFLTLDSCYKLAIAQNPLSRQQLLFSESNQFQESVLNSNYLPLISLGGQFSWQSDVTALPITIPNVNIPTLDKESYKLNLDINQLIWDGGANKKLKALENAGLLINLKSVEAENYRLREIINQVYFNILLISENQKLLRLSMAELNSRLSRIRAGVANGTVLQSNADVIDAEIIKIEQSLTELTHSRAAALFRLGELTGLQLSPETELVQPVFDSLPLANTRLRPEFKLLELQQDKLSIQQEMTGLKLMPRISAFGSLGYGKPGLNMLSNQFDAFAMAGARFSWNLWNWNQNRKESRIIAIQKEVLETQKESYERNQKILLNNLREEILKNENMVASDHRIVRLRESIEKSAGAQLEQGIITSSEYLTEKNAQIQAKINLSLHTIQLQFARLNYISTIGLLK